MKPTLFQQCNILYIDHLAVTTPNIEKTLADYLCMPGTRLLRGPALNPLQNVLYAFVQLAEGLVVEILAAREGSPVSRHVSHGGGPYHLCFAVTNMEASIRAAEQMGARVITSPISDIAFDDRRIAFLFHEAHGMFEFVEAYPATIDNITGCMVQESTISAHAVSPAMALRDRLADIVRKIFNETEISKISQTALNYTPGWDSLGHIRLMMVIEAEFGLNIPTAQIPVLTNFVKICAYLENAAHISETL